MFYSSLVLGFMCIVSLVLEGRYHLHVTRNMVDRVLAGVKSGQAFLAYPSPLFLLRTAKSNIHVGINWKIL